MTIYHHKAIELKYRGYTYREISKALNGKISEQVLKNLFSLNGNLYIPYLEYQAKQNNWAEEHSKEQLKRLSAHTGEVRKTLLKHALERKDYRLALDIVKDIDDRAGNVVVRKIETKEQPKPISNYDDYLAECTRLGIDPNTGFPIGAQQKASN